MKKLIQKYSFLAVVLTLAMTFAQTARAESFLVKAVNDIKYNSSIPKTGDVGFFWHWGNGDSYIKADIGVYQYRSLKFSVAGLESIDDDRPLGFGVFAKLLFDQSLTKWFQKNGFISKRANPSKGLDLGFEVGKLFELRGTYFGLSAAYEFDYPKLR